MSTTTQGTAERLFAGSFKGLGIGNDTLGASIGIKDGVRNLVGSVAGPHVVVVILGVGGEVLVVFFCFVVGRSGRITVFRVRGCFLLAVLEDLVEFFLGRGHSERRRKKNRRGRISLKCQIRSENDTNQAVR